LLFLRLVLVSSILSSWHLLIVVIFLFFLNAILGTVDAVALGKRTKPLFVIAERFEIVVSQELFYHFD